MESFTREEFIVEILRQLNNFDKIILSNIRAGIVIMKGVEDFEKER